MQLGCARNRNDPRLLCKQPSKRELSRCRLLLLREFAEQINQRLVRFTVLWVKAWDGVAEIRAIELRIFLDLALNHLPFWRHPPEIDGTPHALIVGFYLKGAVRRKMSRPAMSENPEVTLLLSALTRGDDGAASKLVPVVYDELRRLAASYMRRERVDHTLQATALVHEAYLKLIEQRSVNWQSRAHFFGVAAQLMRRILIDHARGHSRQKRGGEQKKVSLDEAFVFSEQQADELLAVDDSLNRLAKIDPRQARVVELRFFSGLSVEETAEVLGVSPKTIKRDWSVAKAWLYADLKERHGIDASAMGERQSAV
jgi:RNA polymerase sigma-70 factor (ECF subfamily)